MNYQHAEVATLDPQTMRTLCEEYIANNYIDPETSERLGVKRGLRNPDGTGVLAGLTNVCDVVGYKKDQEGHVIPIPGKLIYRGVNIEEIVEEAYRNDRFVFEEVIWLLLFGSLPTQTQLDDFCALLAEHRALPDGFMDTMNAPSPNVMNKMQRCVLGLYSYDEHAEDLSLENILNQSINLIASKYKNLNQFRVFPPLRHYVHRQPLPLRAYPNKSQLGLPGKKRGMWPGILRPEFRKPRLHNKCTI